MYTKQISFIFLCLRKNVFLFFFYTINNSNNMVSVVHFFAEIVGTLIFLLAIIDLAFHAPAADVRAPSAVPLYIGLGLAVSIYITQGLGGIAHLNPAASAVAAANGAINIGDMGLLILAQCIGAFLAYLVWWGMGRKVLPA